MNLLCIAHPQPSHIGYLSKPLASPMFLLHLELLEYHLAQEKLGSPVIMGAKLGKSC